MQVNWTDTDRLGSESRDADSYDFKAEGVEIGSLKVKRLKSTEKALIVLLLLVVALLLSLVLASYLGWPTILVSIT